MQNHRGPHSESPCARAPTGRRRIHVSNHPTCPTKTPCSERGKSVHCKMSLQAAGGTTRRRKPGAQAHGVYAREHQSHMWLSKCYPPTERLGSLADTCARYKAGYPLGGGTTRPRALAHSARYARATFRHLRTAGCRFPSWSTLTSRSEWRMAACCTAAFLSAHNRVGHHVLLP